MSGSVAYTLSSISRKPENFVLEDDSTIEHSRGRDFVDSLVSNVSSEHHVPKKEYAPFRKMFWENPLYNPPIGNPFKISYEQQFGEMAAHWSRAGKKFSDEPRLADHTHENEGPTRPEEFPHFSEHPVTYWGHERVIDPFRVARYTAKPVTRHVARQKKSKIEETAHLGPGMYHLQDPWLDSKKKVCGIERPSSCFLSHRKDELTQQQVVHPKPHTSKLRSLMQRPADRVSVPPDADASNIMPLATGARNSTSINEMYPARAAGSYTAGYPAMSANSGMRKARTAASSEVNAGGDHNLLSGYLQLSDSDVNSLTTEGDQALTTNQLNSVTVVGFGFEQNGTLTAASRSRPASPEMSVGNTMPARSTLSPMAQSRKSNIPKKKPSSPGFSFQKGELGPNAIDVPNGSTDADKTYRRVAAEDGSYQIIPVSPTDRIPSGSRIIASWATMASSMHHDDTEQLNSHGILLVNDRNSTQELVQERSPSSKQVLLAQSRSLLSTAIPPQVKSPKPNSRSGRSSPNVLPGSHTGRHLGNGTFTMPSLDSTTEPTIAKHTPWHPPKYQSRSHAQKAYETRLMKKFNISPEFNRSFSGSQAMEGEGNSGGFSGMNTAPAHFQPIGQMGMRRKEQDTFNNNRSAVSRNLRNAENIDAVRTREFTQRSSALLASGGTSLTLEMESVSNSNP